MGAIKDTYTLTVNRLTGDGNGGYWWVAVDSNTKVYQINYAGPSEIVSNAGTLYSYDTFISLLAALVANNISLPSVEVNINLNDVSEANSIQDQFDLSPQQLDSIAANFDIVQLCNLFGIFQLIKLFYLNGNMTLSQLSQVLLYLGENGKITERKAEQVTGFLLLSEDITQAQYDAFWVSWVNQVG